MTNNTDTKTTRPRIGTLTPGQRVELRFGNSPSTETVTFLRHETGEETGGQRAVFEDTYNSGEKFEWQAYRFNNRWAFGTSAQPLRLLRVVEDEAPDIYVDQWTVFDAEETIVEGTVTSPAPFGDNTFRVIDERAGGVVAYAGSEETARVIANALRAAHA